MITIDLLEKIDPYKAVDAMGVWFKSFKKDSTIIRCINLLQEYIDSWMDVNDLLKTE